MTLLMKQCFLRFPGSDTEVQRVPIAYTIEHKDYNEMSFHNDIALLVLENDLKFTQNVGPVCLPTQKIPLDGEWIKVLGENIHTK